MQPEPLPDPADTASLPGDQEPMSIDRGAFKRLVAVILITIVAVAIAAGGIALQAANDKAEDRIEILEKDLNERRALRDRQQREGQQIVCTVLGHLVDPYAPEIQDIRKRYRCPEPTSTAKPPPAAG